MSSMPAFTFDPDDIHRKMRACPAFSINWEGNVYRTSKTKYATVKELLTGEGSRRSGGRWNRGNLPWVGQPPNHQYPGFPAVYTSLNFETAASETLAYVKYYALDESSVFPSTSVYVRVKLHKVLNLADDSRVLNQLKVPPSVIRSVDWRRIQDSGGEAITHRIGREARESGFEGILVPSAAHPTGKNLVLFVDQKLPKSTWSIIDPEKQLPDQGGRP